MAAVVRVKRRFHEEPAEAIILSRKKRKLNDDDAENRENPELSTALLEFAGTIKEDENVVAHLKKERIPELTELKEHFKKHTLNISEKLREQVKEASKSNRYKVVNCFRSQGVEDASETKTATTESEFTIFDIETDLNDNTMTENKNSCGSEPKFVYDLYYTNSDDFGEADIEDYISICPVNDSFLLESCYDNGFNNIVDSDGDSEDSNAENNWRNDYPDEDDLESVNEDDIVAAMQSVDINEDLLSSDEGEEDLVYSVNDSDVLRYGEHYAKFKAQHNDFVTSTTLEKDFYYGDIDEDEYYY